MTINIDGVVPGAATPIEKGRGTCDTLSREAATNYLNFYRQLAIIQALDSEAMTIQIARLAPIWHYVIKGCEGDFLVCKFGLSRYSREFVEFQEVSAKLGVTYHG
jgi:hypothetical protein